MKKEQTMWAIITPWDKPMYGVLEKKSSDAWQVAFDITDLINKVELKRRGYRAVKGKFVWEEKEKK